MDMNSSETWIVIVAIGIGSFLIRFSFVGLIGDRKLPDWVLRHLRYTPVAVIPGMVAPLVLWPPATGGEPDLARLLAAGAALTIGYVTKNVLASIFAGVGTLYLALYTLNILG